MEFFTLGADPAVAFLLSLIHFDHQATQVWQALERQKVLNCNAWSYEMTTDPNDMVNHTVKPARLYCEKDS